MKLVFYSGGYAHENEKVDARLISLFEKQDLKLTFIPSCGHYSQEYYLEIIDQYKPFGIKKFMKFNIDQPFSDTLKRFAFSADIIHLGGGNTFYFLKTLRKAGLLNELRQWVKAGGVLTGLSAGAIMMTNHIQTAGFPSFDCDDNEYNLKNLSALQLVDFEFFPHYKNSKRYDNELLEYSKHSARPLYACPDGSGILVNHEEVSFIGKAFCFYAGNKFRLA